MLIDPIRTNITMKKVIGFHSLDLGFLIADLEFDFRRGFGMRLAQKDVEAIDGAEAYDLGPARAGR